MSYLIAAYAVVLGSLAAYALSLLRRRRALLAAEREEARSAQPRQA